MNKYNNKGQAILELAVFGSIVVMLLGVLVNYALRYNFQQQVTMKAFRKALASAAVSSNTGYPKSTSHIIIQDRHIPDPGGFLGIGSVSSASSTASVTRDYRLHAVADNTSELPRMVIDINGRAYTYTQAGTWTDDDVSGDELKKFQEIFGDSNLIYDEGFAGGPVTVVDFNYGQIVDYGAARRICRQVRETDFCTSECEQGRWASGDEPCSTICSYSIDTPPYCEDLDTIFAFAQQQNADGETITKPKAMGVQMDYQQTDSNDSSLQKDETYGGVTTTKNRKWQSTITRTIRHKEGADTNQSVIGQDESTSW